MEGCGCVRVALFVFAGPAAVAGSSAVLAQGDIRSPLPAPVKLKQGMLNVPALSPVWVVAEVGAKNNGQIETVMVQRFGGGRSALGGGGMELRGVGRVASHGLDVDYARTGAGGSTTLGSFRGFWRPAAWGRVMRTGVNVSSGPPSGSRETFRWTDDHGVTTWTDRVDSVPERYRAQVRRQC